MSLRLQGIGSSVGPFQAMPPGVATDVIGMGSWRLRGEVEPAIEFLVGQLEGTWRELLGDELTLYPRDKWKSRGWDLIDSMDLGRELGGFAYADVPDPEPGADGYPRLLVENRLYCSRVFRKLHLEVAVRQDGLHVLHVVMYPRYEYDLPIFAMDVVASKGVVTLAIVDACPSRGDKSLPPQYLQTMAALQEEFLHPPGQAGSSSSGRQRAVPDWGAEIFSPLCVSIAPRTPDELSRFARYCLALHRAHLQLARLLTPVPESAPDRRASLHDGHQRFVANQLQNKKTTRVLEAAWYPDGKELAEQYMAQLLFDYSPQDAPPWHDASVGRLYSYFETAPEPSRDEKEAKAFVIKVNVEKASGYLADFMTGGRAVTTAKMEWALAYLFEHDDEYRSAVSAVLPGWQQHQAEGTLGAVLLEELQRQTGGAAGNKKPPMP